MARPARPATERAAVLAASERFAGSAGKVAKRIAHAVVTAALRAFDGDPTDRIVAMLNVAEVDAVWALATDDAIGTGDLIAAERRRRMELRGWRRLPERDWAAEDSDVRRAVCAVLARRYARILRDDFRP